MTTLSVRERGAIFEGLRVAVHFVVWSLLAVPLFGPAPVFAAGLGGAVGVWCGTRLASSRVRTAPGALALVVATLLAWSVHAVAVRWSLFADVLGPAFVLALADVFLCAAVALFGACLVRLLSTRRAVFVLLETLLAIGAFAALVVAHRHGAINRPFAVADPIIAAGGDPSWVFLLVGAFAVLASFVLLLRERELRRIALHLAAAVLLLGLVLATTRMAGPRPDTAAGLGLGGKSDEKKPDGAHQPRDGEGSGDQTRKRSSNEELEFRDNYSENANQVPVAVVVFHDDYSPPTGVYYFRQGAFSLYNGRRMVSAARVDVDRDLIPAFPSSPLRIPEAPGFDQYRASLDTTVVMMADHSRPFALEAPVEVAPVQNPDPGRFRRAYRATSAVLTVDYGFMLGSRTGSSAWSDEQWAHYTEAPKDPRYAELANRIVQEMPSELKDDDVAKAFAVTEWLGRQGIYSMKNKHTRADDPTASFLFGDLTGYCVHFAHAAVYLLRTLGVPTRVATGYAIDESARRGGSALLLAGSYSHAWPEMYVDGFGWVVIDVAPQRTLDPPPQPLDADLQQLLGELARGQSPLPPVAASIPRLKKLLLALLHVVREAFGYVVLFVLLALYVIKLWRRLAPRFASPDSLPRLAYRADLDRLGELSLRRRSGESREAFAQRVHATVPSLAALTWAHLRSRFGLKGAAAQDIEALSVSLRHELKRTFKAWRRLLGILTPWSWLRTR